MWLLAVLACTDPTSVPSAADRARLVEALHLLPSEPEAARARCRRLRGPVRGDCMVAVVESAPDHHKASAWCESLPEGVYRDECHFQRAEGLVDLDLCQEAGRFVEDCRLHVWTTVASDWTDEPLDDQVSRAKEAMVELGIDSDDRRFWSALFRGSLDGPGHLDRRPCESLDDPELRDECLGTGISVWHDRINRARDSGPHPCPRVPSSLRHSPDPELVQILAARWPEICSGRPPPARAMTSRSPQDSPK